MQPDSSDTQLANAALPAHLFRQAVEQAALAISITDAAANILYSNTAFSRMTGYAAEQIKGHNESMLSYRMTPKLVYETLWAQIRRQRPWNGLLVNKRQDGSRYLAEVTITPVLNEQGATTHYLGMQRDVTEVHRLERQVQNQKKLIESVVDAAPVAMVLLDEQERVVLDNHAYKKLVASLGKEPALRLLAALRSQLGEAFVAAQTHHHNLPAQEVCIELAGRASLWFTCALSWFEEQDMEADAFYAPQRRHYLLLTIQDINAQKQQQETLRINSLRALLAEQERIQGLRETLAGALYQIESPFNVICAVAQVLERRLSTQSGHELSASALEVALQQGRAALETLRASIPSPLPETMQPVNLNEVLVDVLKLTTADLLSNGIVVEWQPLPEPALVMGHLAQLSTVFKQLISNAIEAICERRDSTRELRLRGRHVGDCVEIFVEDSGAGVAEALRYKVFQPFFTTKGGGRRPHLGLGLAMAQEIITSHHGAIDIAPDFTTGCRVRVQLHCLTGVRHE